MDNTGGGRTGAGTEVGFFHEQGIYTLQGQFAEEADAIDSTSDNQD